MSTFYKIEVKKQGGAGYRLFNCGEIAGNRLYKGDPQTDKVKWPFRGEKWNYFATPKLAEIAARQLQDYLDEKALKETGKTH